MNPEIPIIQRRRIEAEIIRPIFLEMVKQLGREKSISILETAITRNAKTHGKESRPTDKKSNNMSAFVKLYQLWMAEDALQVEVLEASDHNFDFNVTGCRYAEMYRDLGIPELGSILSCGRDKHFCNGFNPNLKLKRTQTIMQGSDFCDFRYRLNNGSESQ